MDNNPKLIIIAGILIALLVIGGAAFWYWQKRKAVAPVIPSGGTVESLIEKITPLNPLNKLPDTNPVDKTNPFKNLETNPFK